MDKKWPVPLSTLDMSLLQCHSLGGRSEPCALKTKAQTVRTVLASCEELLQDYSRKVTMTTWHAPKGNERLAKHIMKITWISWLSR